MCWFTNLHPFNQGLTYGETSVGSKGFESLPGYKKNAIVGVTYFNPLTAGKTAI